MISMPRLQRSLITVPRFVPGAVPQALAFRAFGVQLTFPPQLKFLTMLCLDVKTKVARWLECCQPERLRKSLMVSVFSVPPL
jgi:hypothetical protein